MLEVRFEHKHISWPLGSIWHQRSTSRDTACTVAWAFLGSRLNYYNAFMVGMSEANLHKLQRVKIAFARVIMGTRHREHIKPVLADQHWLPIRAKITSKIVTLVFKVREVKQPIYFAVLIEGYKPIRELRSTFKLLLKEPHLNEDHYVTKIATVRRCQDMEQSSRSY